MCEEEAGVQQAHAETDPKPAGRVRMTTTTTTTLLLRPRRLSGRLRDPSFIGYQFSNPTSVINEVFGGFRQSQGELLK